MKTVWKWIIGIVLGVLVLVLLVGVPIALHFSRQAAFFQAAPDWHMRGFEHMPMMRGYGGIGRFGMVPFGGFFGGLIGFGLLVLLVLGIVWVVKSLSAPKTPMRACIKCGKPLQNEWKVCPYCGNKVKS